MAKRVSFKKRMRRLEVRLQRDPRVQRIVRNLYAGYLGLVQRTTRWSYLGVDRYRPGGDERPAVMVTWHALLACTPFMGPMMQRNCKALASDHPDGQIVLELLKALDIEPILISTSKSKTHVLMAAIEEVRTGATLGITTDGPMGPRGRTKPGAVIIAGAAGAPIVPAGFAARPALRLPTWDRFVVPLPFGRAVMSLGDPIEVPEGLSEDEITAFCRRVDAAIDAEITRCETRLRERA